MSSIRLATAAILFAALLTGGAAASEPPGRDVVMQDAADTASPSSANLYRAASDSGRTDRFAFALGGTARQAVVPGSAAALAQRPTEPLAPSATAPQLAHREVAFAYASDGRVTASVATLQPGGSAGSARAGTADCCGTAPGSTSPAEYYAKGAEAPEVRSLFARLKAHGLKLALQDGWKVDAGARSREYSNGAFNSRIGHITVRRWWGDFSTAYSLQVEKRGGWDVAPSQAVSLGYAFAPRTALGVTYTTGEEIAFFALQGVRKTEVRALSLHGEHAVDKRWSLDLDAGYYEHGELPTTRGVRIGFRCSL